MVDRGFRPYSWVNKASESRPTNAGRSQEEADLREKATTTMTTSLHDQPVPPDSPPAPTGPDRGLRPEHIQDAQRDVLLAVQRGLSANWNEDRPRIAVVERDGLATVYVSTVQTLRPAVRADVRGAVRTALASYIRLAPYTNVVFLRRGKP